VNAGTGIRDQTWMVVKTHSYCRPEEAGNGLTDSIPSRRRRSLARHKPHATGLLRLTVIASVLTPADYFYTIPLQPWHYCMAGRIPVWFSCEQLAAIRQLSLSPIITPRNF